MTSVVHCVMTASPECVYDVLADGWTYAAWVVGASRVRGVDPNWPQEGARIHHSIGAWPLLVNDETTSMRSEPHRGLELDVTVWFVGRGRVSFQIEPDGESGCRVTMRESMTRGLLSKLPTVAVDFLLHHRNTETLRRLAAITEGRADTTT